MWKALSVFAALLAAGAAFFSFLNKTDLEKEQQLLGAAQNHQEQIVKRHTEVKDQLVAFDKKQEAMEGYLADESQKRDDEKTKLEEKEREVMETNDKIKELEAEIADAKERIAEFGNIEELAKLIDQLNTDIFNAKQAIASLEQQLDATTTREVQTVEKIQSYKDLEYRQRNGQMVATNASVASVYNSWGFAVLNAGDQQGIVSKAKLDVMRGGDKIAELVVTNLERNRSVCDIVPGSMEPGQMIRPGDKVAVNEDSLPKPKAEAEVIAPDGDGVAPANPIPSVPVEPGNVPDDPFAEFGLPESAPETPAEKPADPTDPFSDL